MKQLYLFVLVFFFLTGLHAKDVQDSVHVKIGEKIYFSSDFINLQHAIKSRLCSAGSNVLFLDLVTNYLKDKKVSVALNNQSLSEANAHFKTNDLQALILIFKMIQILVEQQVSFQGSSVAAIPEKCVVTQAEAPKKVVLLYQKLAYLDDLLAMKTSAEKDQNKKRTSLVNIIDSLDKQIKYEILVKLE